MTFRFWLLHLPIYLAYNKNKLYKLKTNFSEKGVGLVSPPHFVYDFSRKLFLMLHSFDWPNFTVWLPLILEMLDNMRITIVWNLKFEINLTFLIKPLCLNLNILRRKIAFEVKYKAFLIIFKGVSVVKSFLRPMSAPLKI